LIDNKSKKEKLKKKK